MTAMATNETPGLVCAHHHLYSSLARLMPAPPSTPTSFVEILNLVWWRLDRALDLDIIRHSARLGALEALARGTTTIIDHHESPTAIDGSLDVIAEACAEVGVRVICSYGVTDRHGPSGARAGLDENRRFLASGGRGMVGVHAAFTCSDETLAEAAAIAAEFDVGVHIHVAEGEVDRDAAERVAGLSTDRWLLVHGVHLADDHGISGTVVHNPRSNMNNAVGYARPARMSNDVALGTDGIGADMLDEFRLAFVAARSADLTTTPDQTWSWLECGWKLVPDAASDRVRWDVPSVDPWYLAYTTGVNPLQVTVNGEVIWSDGAPTRVDPDEVRAHAFEAQQRLFQRLEEIS